MKKNILFTKGVACVLILALFISMIPFSTTKARITEENVYAWFSRVSEGGYYPYANSGSTVFLNIYSPENANIAITIEKDSSRLSFYTYTNTPRINKSLTFSEEGLYQAHITVTNSQTKEVVEKEAVIGIVSGLPVITRHPVSTFAKSYENATFSVASEQGCTYQWWKANRLDEKGSELSGSISSTLIVTNKNVVSENHNKYFYCVVTKNGKRITSDYAKLTITNTETPSGGVSPSTSSSNSNASESTPLTIQAKYNNKKGIVVTSNSTKKITVYYKIGKNSRYTKGTKNVTIKPAKDGTYTVWAVESGRKSNVVKVKASLRPVFLSPSAKKRGRKIQVKYNVLWADYVKVYVKTDKKYISLKKTKVKSFKLTIPKSYKKATIKLVAVRKGSKKTFSKTWKSKTIKF